MPAHGTQREVTQPAGEFHATAARKDQPGGIHWRLQELRKGQWELYYDGDCEFCRRWAIRVQRVSHPQIRWRSFRETADDVAHLAPRFDQAAYLIINRRLALPGFAAFRKLVMASPKLWLLLPLVYFPGSRWLGAALYRWISTHYGPVSPDPTFQHR